MECANLNCESFISTSPDNCDCKLDATKCPDYIPSSGMTQNNWIKAHETPEDRVREYDQSENNGGSTDYYKLPQVAKDLQDLIEYKNMNFSVGNIFKASYRIGEKNDPVYELNKIIFFANRELKRIAK